MSKAQHTPTPWVVTGSSYQMNENYVRINSEDRNTNPANSRVAGTFFGVPNTPKSREEAEANAAHIVKCVNLHDELVELIQRYMGAYPAFRVKPVGSPGSEKRIEQENLMALEDSAKALLAKARSAGEA